LISELPVTPIVFILVLLLISVLAGFLGGLLGLGGGIVVVPALTLGLGINIRYAIGASIVSVIATSSGAAAMYVRERLANLRVAMLLEIATTSGAITGAFLAGVLPTRFLYLLFGGLMTYSALAIFRKRRHADHVIKPDRWADTLQLHSAYFDEATHAEREYRVTRTKLGLFLMYLAGNVSGLLGIGSGALKVPAMDLAMGLPIKVSTATSNFMIGVTAAASAGVYFSRGDMDPFIAGPVAAGVLIGATLASLILNRISAQKLRYLFAVVLLFISLQMLYHGLFQ
jgi:uncharacterized membrane protein YfcA